MKSVLLSAAAEWVMHIIHLSSEVLFFNGMLRILESDHQPSHTLRMCTIATRTFKPHTFTCAYNFLSIFRPHSVMLKLCNVKIVRECQHIGGLKIEGAELGEES